MNTRSTAQRIRRGSMLLLTAAFCAATAAGNPRTVAAAESADSECTDEAWASYNSCLMKSSFEVIRKLCDLEFFLAVYNCGMEEAGA